MICIEFLLGRRCILKGSLADTFHYTPYIVYVGVNMPISDETLNFGKPPAAPEPVSKELEFEFDDSTSLPDPAVVTVPPGSSITDGSYQEFFEGEAPSGVSPFGNPLAPQPQGIPGAGAGEIPNQSGLLPTPGAGDINDAESEESRLLGELGALTDKGINIGADSYFDERSKARNNDKYPFLGGNNLIYPEDLGELTFQNRQTSAIKFKVFKRKSQKLSARTRKAAEGESGFGVFGDRVLDVGFTDAEDNLTGGFTVSGGFGSNVVENPSGLVPNLGGVNDDTPAQAGPNESRLRKATFGNFGQGSGVAGAAGGVFGGAGLSDDQLIKFRDRVASDLRLSKADEELNEQIILYMPSTLSFNDKVNYTEASAGAFNAINEAFAGNFAAAGDKAKLLGISQVSKALGEFIPGVGDSDLNNFFSATVGVVENPRNESLFKDVTRKTFKFDFKFAPRSSQESLIMLNIIEAFRFHMLPEVSASGALLLSPHEFEIDFLFKDLNSRQFVTNLKMPKIGRAFCTAVNVDYTPNDRSSFFMDGTPTEVNLSVEFDQALLLNRQLIQAGF